MRFSTPPIHGGSRNFNFLQNWLIQPRFHKLQQRQRVSLSMSWWYVRCTPKKFHRKHESFVGGPPRGRFAVKGNFEVFTSLFWTSCKHIPELEDDTTFPPLQLCREDLDQTRKIFWARNRNF
ncbi:PREDICTED: uncharacterized protein LOC105126808 isoform X2 [Populus euphratica]|uniref:Uncharacterized protein LOC105116560 isoform X2 n=1 Tax=Populus euphratica TaxID=75702 RepID=A0AAJ6XBB7_POPEU|nr:PREDICTED: uncharacterized protein LOC105116560 isoform X2 [Populus euphratica]XP_011026100.1 PREDICTED: uncharacterized protein LOC105126808 isoform X2 [Populus euphratica]